MSEPTQTPETATASQHHVPKVSVHRWPWRTEEFISMAFVFLLIIGLGYLALSTARENISGAIALGILALTPLAGCGAVYYLYRVKKKRTDTSQVTITIIGSLVRSESKGPLGKSQGDLTKTKTVSYRRYNSDETFMIGDGEKALRVPVRATSDPHVREAIETALANAEHVADEARDLFNRMPAVKNTK